MMKKALFAICIAIPAGITGVNAQIVNIPDANFKSYLLSHSGINTNSDNEIQVSEAQAFAGAIDCVNKGIADLTGIEAFTALTILQCNDNSLTSLDLGSNTALTRLACHDNSLTSLNISNCTALTELGCNGNSLASLDLSNCTVLSYLSCNNNLLTSLNLSSNTAVGTIFCGNNRLSSLNLSSNTALIMLQCSDNWLTSLNVNNCTALRSLMCSGNSLTSLDLSNNAALTTLYCDDNSLASLDLSSNTALTILVCDNNQLASLNVKNGNNTNFISFTAINNHNLTCVDVDDEAYSSANWTGTAFRFDAGVHFSEDCSNTSVNDVFNDASFTVYPNPATSLVTIANIPDGSVLNIMDLTGRTVYTSTAGGNQATINMADFVNGTYLIRVDYNGSVAGRRLLLYR